MKALIALEDGTTFAGQSFTGHGEAVGEIVFNTSLSGYQEILTDPSYTGQIVTMTYPLIGNYGINPEDMESAGIHPRAFLIKEYQAYPSNFRATRPLADFLQEYGILGVQGFDTRALVRHIRSKGAMKGIVSTLDLDPVSRVRRATEWPGFIGRDLVKDITCKEPYGWADNRPVPGDNFSTAKAASATAAFRWYRPTPVPKPFSPCSLTAFFSPTVQEIRKALRGLSIPSAPCSVKNRSSESVLVIRCSAWPTAAGPIN